MLVSTGKGTDSLLGIGTLVVFGIGTDFTSSFVVCVVVVGSATTAEDAALPLARVVIGSAWPATSKEAINSFAIDNNAISLDPGLATSASNSLTYRVTSPAPPVVYATANNFRTFIGSDIFFKASKSAPDDSLWQLPAPSPCEFSSPR